MIIVQKVLQTDAPAIAEPVHGPIDGIIDLWMPGIISRKKIRVIYHIANCIRQLKTSECLGLAIAHSEDEVAGTANSLETVDGLLKRIIKL